LGSCYFIPYKNTVSFQIGYKGLIDLVTRKGDCLNIVAQEVCENDEFFYEFGRNENLKHVPSTGNRGKPKFYYAYANLRNGGFVFQVMSIEEIERIRDMYSIGYKFDKTGSIWAKNFDSMALKTVIKKLIKYMPISVETASAIQFDETVRKDISSEPEFIQPDIIDIPRLEVVSEGGELNA
jgi:recombination protein RecT